MGSSKTDAAPNPDQVTVSDEADDDSIDFGSSPDEDIPEQDTTSPVANTESSPEQVTITVTWDDYGNTGNTRPDNLYVTVYTRRSSDTTITRQYNTSGLEWNKDGDTWTCSFSTEEDDEVVYNVSQTIPSGYSQTGRTITGNDIAIKNGKTATLTLTKTTVDGVEGNFIFEIYTWIEAPDGSRLYRDVTFPSQTVGRRAYVNLHNGTGVHLVTIPGNDSILLSNLLPGMHYEIIERHQGGWRLNSYENDTGIISSPAVVSTFENEKAMRDVVLRKKWSDNNNAEGKRPDDIRGYIASDFGEVYAVYDSADQSLTFFYDNRGKYIHNQVEGTKTYYTDVEAMGGSATTCGWHNVRSQIRTVNVQCVVKPGRMGNWFSEMVNLESIEGLNNFDTSNCAGFGAVFYNCRNLRELDLSSFDASRVQTVTNMFGGCASLEHIYVSDKWVLSNLATVSTCFNGCVMLPNYSPSQITSTMAHYGEGGYLEYKEAPDTSGNTNAEMLLTEPGGWTKQGNEWTYTFSVPYDAEISDWGEEPVPSGYRVVSKAREEGTDIYTVENELISSDITVNKVTEGGGDDTFYFRVKAWKNDPGTSEKTYYDLTRSPGVRAVAGQPGTYRFQIKTQNNTGSHQLLDIPEGYQYEIWEVNAEGDKVEPGGFAANEWKLKSATQDTGSVTGEDITATFVNEHKQGAVKVTKRTEEDKAGTFDFKVKVWKETPTEAYARLDADGVLTFFRDTPHKYENEETDGTYTYYTGVENTGAHYAGRSISEALETIPWNHATEYTDAYADYTVKRVVFEDPIRPVNTYAWFFNMLALETIEGFEMVDTSLVTKMNSMFEDSRNLKSVNTSNMDTSNVVDMFAMFRNCSSLTQLDVSSFDTTSLGPKGVINMFSGCSSLTELDVTHFDTSNIEDMTSMFRGCSNLEVCDSSHFDTSKLTRFPNLYYGCSKLNTTLNIQKVPVERGGSIMNAGEITLKYSEEAQEYVTGWLASVSSNPNIHAIDGGLIGDSFMPPTPPEPVTPVRIQPIVEYMDLSSKGGSATSDEGEYLFSLNNGESFNLDSIPFGYKYEIYEETGEGWELVSIDADTSKTLAEGQIESEDTVEHTFLNHRIEKPVVVEKTWEDEGNADLTRPEHLDITLVTDLDGVDITRTRADATIDKSTDPNKWVYTWYVDYDETVSSVTETVPTAYTQTKEPAFNEASGKYEITNTLKKHSLTVKKETDQEDRGDSFDFRISVYKLINELPQAYAYVDSADGSLVFFRGEENEYTNGQVEGTKTYYTDFETVDQNYFTPPWLVQKDTITSVRFEDYIRPNRTTYWFKECVNLHDADFTKLDTSRVTNMYQMFYRCTSLEALDLTPFNTENVWIMSYMFARCENLVDLDISSFDTSTVHEMYCMFQGCSSIEEIDLSSFNTANAGADGTWFQYAMQWMFDGCTNLKSVNLLTFDTSNVVGFYFMFNGCKSLTELDLSSFDTESLWRLQGMFQGCYDIEHIYVSEKWDLSNTDPGGSPYVFAGDSKLPNYLGPTYTSSYYAHYGEGGYMEYRPFNRQEPVVNTTNQTDSSILQKRYYDLSGYDGFTATSTEGVYSFTLSKDGTISVPEIPYGYDYEIWEVDSSGNKVTPGADVSDAWMLYSKENDTGTIADEDLVSTFVNHIKRFSIEISKSVAGNMGNKENEFSFTFTSADLAGKTISINGSDVTVPNNGVYAFTLGHNGRMTLGGIPYGTEYKVKEDDYRSSGYTTSVDVTGDTLTNDGTMSEDEIPKGQNLYEVSDTSITKDTGISFTNTRSGVIPTGLDSNIIVLGACCVLALLACVYLFKLMSSKNT